MIVRAAGGGWLAAALAACASQGLDGSRSAEPTQAVAVPEGKAEHQGKNDEEANDAARAETKVAAPPDDPKAALLAHLGRSDEAAEWTELGSDAIEDSDDRVIAFQRLPEEPAHWEDEDELPSVEVEVVAVTVDGTTHPLHSQAHSLFECDSMEVYATALKDAPQVVWIDLSCRSGEDFWSIEVDSILYLRSAEGPWSRLWAGTQSVSGQWNACRDAEEIDVAVRDGALVIDRLRYRDYTPEPDDHVKRSDCPPRKLRRERLATISLPTP